MICHILDIVDRRKVAGIWDEMTPAVETVFVKVKQNFSPGEPFFDKFDEKTVIEEIKEKENDNLRFLKVYNKLYNWKFCWN